MYIFWGAPGTSNGVFTGPFLGRQTGTYGYYRVDDFGTRGDVGGNITSLYAQDTWSVTSRLVLNLGLRTEHEIVPSFQPAVKPDAFNFPFSEKLAPRLGAAFDIRGDGRMKLSGSWGRYYDWTKYSIARGSYGGDLWHIFYRSLDTTDIGEPEPEQHAGPRLVGQLDGVPRPSRDQLREHRPEHQADVPGQHERRIRIRSSTRRPCSASTTCTTS